MISRQLPGGLDEVPVPGQMPKMEIRQAALVPANQFTRTTQAQIGLGDLKAVAGVGHDFHSSHRLLRL